jgi:GTPase SAR1 family protein
MRACCFDLQELQNNGEDDVLIVLVGTKCDLAADPKFKGQGIPWKEVEAYASRINAAAFSTSSKTGQNVDAVFQSIADKMSVKPRAAVQVPTPGRGFKVFFSPFSLVVVSR